MSYSILTDIHVLHKMILKVRCDPRFADPRLRIYRYLQKHSPLSCCHSSWFTRIIPVAAFET